MLIPFPMTWCTHRHRAVGLKDIALDHIILNLHNHDVRKNLDDLADEPELLIEIVRRIPFVSLSSPASTHSNCAT